MVTDVLSATLELFAEQGYQGLSFEAVAARAGVNKTTIYRRWPSKPELVGAALFYLRDSDAEPPDTGSLREDLQQVLQRWAERMATPRHRAIMHAFSLGNTDPEMQAVLRRIREERPAIPRLLFERALKRGELPKGSDLELISAALLGPIHTRVYWKREPASEEFISNLVKLVVAGAAAGGAR